jgi:hypothetical protein
MEDVKSDRRSAARRLPELIEAQVTDSALHVLHRLEKRVRRRQELGRNSGYRSA